MRPVFVPRLGLLGVLTLCASLGGGPIAAHAKKPPPRPEPEAKDSSKEQAQQAFDKGMKLYDLRKFDLAITEFERAYQLTPQAAFLYNIAQSHRLAGRRDEAIAFYQNYLRRMPNAPNREEVEEQVRNLLKEKEAAAKSGDKPAAKSVSRTVAAPAQPYPEPKTKHNFLTRIRVGERDHTLVGVGTRSYFGFLVYGMALYAEDEPARAAFPKLAAQAGGVDSAQLRSGDLAQNFFILGEFGKAALLYYVRDVSTKQIRESYRDMLKDNLRDSTPPPLRQHTEEFLALFDRDMKTGEEMLIASDQAGRITVSVGSYRRTGPTDPRLALDLWNCWLGPKPLNPELKQDLVRRIAALGQ